MDTSLLGNDSSVSPHLILTSMLNIRYVYYRGNATHNYNVKSNKNVYFGRLDLQEYKIKTGAIKSSFTFMGNIQPEYSQPNKTINCEIKNLSVGLSYLNK